jgi:predicted P-loop ATPase/GTPase
MEAGSSGGPDRNQVYRLSNTTVVTHFWVPTNKKNIYNNNKKKRKKKNLNSVVLTLFLNPRPHAVGVEPRQ